MARKKKRRSSEQVEAEKLKQIRDDKEHAKMLRPYFGEMFKAKSGFDLRSPASWTPANKRRIRKYYETMAPQVTRAHKARRYRRQDHLDEAIAYTQQERLLPGQKAALFAAEKAESIEVSFNKRGVIKVIRQGVGADKVQFDLETLIEDPDKAVAEVLAQLPGAKRYKIMMGPHESRGTWSAATLMDGIAKLLAEYGDETKHDPEDPRSKHFENWMFGIVGYYGPSGRGIDVELRKERKAKDAQIADRQSDYETERTQRRARARKRISKRARLTGRQ